MKYSDIQPNRKRRGIENRTLSPTRLTLVETLLRSSVASTIFGIAVQLLALTMHVTSDATEHASSLAVTIGWPTGSAPMFMPHTRLSFR